MADAQQELAEQVEQQKAAGGVISDSSVRCPVCGDSATQVSPRNVPESGPLEFEECEIPHLDDGTYYYHAK
jgi:hypothetical protein